MSPVSSFLFVGWLVCDQSYVRSTQLINMKCDVNVGWRMCLSQE